MTAPSPLTSRSVSCRQPQGPHLAATPSTTLVPIVQWYVSYNPVWIEDNFVSIIEDKSYNPVWLRYAADG